MSLAAGTRLGSYEIAGPLGAGGMGEVYRARDTKLNRDVALKILPAAFAADPDRLARFRREAHVLASLNHPHIAQIHGFEDSGPTHALVMELVEGPTLADVIAGSAAALHPMAVRDALLVARQIADALEAAHEQGIIHRDLKPANIKVRDDGTVKVLDFGLAKAMDPVGTPAVDAMQSPTLTRLRQGSGEAGRTAMGMILGTAAYMAPEQASGKAVDRRADVWAFGCVLYEMLTGRRAFAGEEISDVLAAVLRETPLLDALPEEVPGPMRRLLRRCLEKDRAKRLDSMRVAGLEIDDALSPAADAAGNNAIRISPAARPSALGRSLWAAVAILALVSPNGRWIAYASNASGRYEVYVQPFPGPGRRQQVSFDGATSPLWARNGRELFFAGELGKDGANPLFAVDVTTGPTFSAGTPRKLFAMRFGLLGGPTGYDVSLDGQRFLMVEFLEPPKQPVTRLRVVFNWFEELRKAQSMSR